MRTIPSVARGSKGSRGETPKLIR